MWQKLDWLSSLPDPLVTLSDWSNRAAENRGAWSRYVREAASIFGAYAMSVEAEVVMQQCPQRDRTFCFVGA
eukprot:9283276-Alexandrium_andersonii.AAC.1